MGIVQIRGITYQGSHTAIIGGGERERVNMFRRTGKVADIKMDVSSHVETVALLSKLSEAKHHIEVKVDMDKLDVTASESKATYEEIQE